MESTDTAMNKKNPEIEMHEDVLPEAAMAASLEEEQEKNNPDGMVEKHIYLNNSTKNLEEQNPPNLIITSKYTIYNFLPLNLLEQFRRVANQYFLLCVFLQFIPGVTPFHISFSIMPLVFILGVTALKDAVEDYYRHVEDSRNNALPTTRLTTDGEWEEVPASAVVVGDFLKIKTGEEVPADCICIGTSSPDGSCYINTASLDGENAPKSRKALPEISKLSDPKELCKVTGNIRCVENFKDLEGFTGVLELDEKQELSQKIDCTNPIGIGDSQFYYRGSLVSSCDYIIALVLFVGVDTKMMLNRGQVPFKFASFEQALNKCVMYLLVFNLLFVLFLALLSRFQDTPEYIEWKEDYDTDKQFGLNFGIQYVVFSFMIPLSLYVTVELVKVVQALYMTYDVQMAVKQPLLAAGDDGDAFETRFAAVKNLALNEELGMVRYIFSDKTGTLTQNKMELSKVCIGGKVYVNDKIGSYIDGQQKHSYGVISEIAEECSQLGDGDSPVLHTDLACHFFRNLLVCSATIPQPHSDAAPEKRKSMSGFQSDLVESPSLSDGGGRQNPTFTQQFVYSSPSPDEVAFADALASHGLEFIARLNNPQAVQVSYNSSKRSAKVSYEIVSLLEFQSARKRMTVVAKDANDRYFVYTKGADDKIATMLHKNQTDVFNETMGHLNEFAREGCRTLLLAYKELSMEEYEKFNEKCEHAVQEIYRRDEFEEKAFESIETNLLLLGCTSVDDNLQSGVPDTIASLKEAGIRITVLTGDKEETAITIARQANIVTEKCYQDGNMSIVRCPKELLHPGREEEAKEHLEKEMNKVGELISGLELTDDSAMLISGNALERAVGCSNFFDIMKKLTTIVCYRCNPYQKMLVVSTAKLHLDGICLAIGDGANDVAMIQESNVGVGIQGQEGSQAALAADFVLHRFRHLKRLLLVHGRFCYYRTAKVVVLSFYKNLCFVFPVAYFSFYNLASTQNLYEGLLMSVFNVFFASFPPFLIGCFEMDIPIDACLDHPKAYRQHVRNPWFNMKNFIMYIMLGILQSMLIFFPLQSIVAENYGIWRGNGMEGDMYSFGNLVFMYAILVVNFQMFIAGDNYPWPVVTGPWLGPILFLMIAGIYESLIYMNFEFYGSLTYILGSGAFWLAWPIIMFVTLVPVMVVNWYKRETNADLRTILHEAYVKGYYVGLTTDEIVSRYIHGEEEEKLR